MLSVLALFAASLVQPPADDLSELQGRIVGVCLRWGADPDHVEEAVVVAPSGHEPLDRGMPESIRRMDWPKPSGESYRGEWVGIWLAIGDVSRAEMPREFPDCSRLPSPPGIRPLTTN